MWVVNTDRSKLRGLSTSLPPAPHFPTSSCTMTAFIPTAAPGAFTPATSTSLATPAHTNASPRRHTCASPASPAPVRMTANWPDDTGPAYSKFLPFIPQDRLNKAPIITINSFSNSDYNSVSVRLADMRADEGAGESLRAGVVPNTEPGPSPALWGKFFDPATVHEAPIISINGRAGDYPLASYSLSVTMTPVPTRLTDGQALLDPLPDPTLYLNRYVGRMNEAPDIVFSQKSDSGEGVVYLNNASVSVSAIQAAQIFSQFE